MSKNLITQLIEDLEMIRDASDFSLKEIDNKVIRALSAVQKHSLPLSDLESIRLELWLAYTNEMIIKLDRLLKNLSLALVNVKPFRVKLNQHRREYKQIKESMEFDKVTPPSKFSKKISDLFYDIINLWNHVADSEDDLRSGAWRNFLIKIYFPFMIVASTAYWYFVTHFKLFLSSPTSAVFWFIVVLFAGYFILKRVVRSPPKPEEETKEES